MTDTAKRVWTVAYWFLTVIFIVTAIISTKRIPAGFLSNYAADIGCPALLYIYLRGLNAPRRPSALGRYFGATPERAAFVLFGGSTLTELSQIWWPQGFFAGTYDPYDIVAYAISVGTCYLFEKVSALRSAK